MDDQTQQTGGTIREKFLGYFESKGHTRVPSAPLVPHNDPTLLFVNAGMVPFKEVFTGVDQRPYARATSSQKCLRVSGKHNDLETVGRTARHHTFFEMLGNFSFGDYFKKDAIQYAWEFLTVEVGLDPEKLYATVYLDDDEAAELWATAIGLPQERIQRFGEKDNFWSMGDTGPCGPCSELHYDRGPKHACDNPDCGIDCECDRFLEVWNLVFMQYDRDKEGNLNPLPRPSVDTGMGLERLVSLVQEKETNFETDLILPIIEAMREIAGLAYGDGTETDISYRVVGDHIRAAVFLIADDVHPSNEGRGYVLRRILRRAFRHGRMLGVEEPFAHRLTSAVIDMMADAYPELRDYESIVQKVILGEEKSFSATLDIGMKLVADMIDEAKTRGDNTIAGAEVFKLYDTYGFPIDLANDIAHDAGVKLDRDGYEKEMSLQQEKARTSWKGSGGEDGKKLPDALTETPPTKFTGYDKVTTEGTRVVALLKNGRPVESASDGESIEIFLASTCFYAESGGQVGDTGTLSSDSFRANVTDVKKINDYFSHQARITTGEIKVGDTVTAKIDGVTRNSIRRNHSATHLLQAALQRTLGPHVKQKGSEVSSQKLRFDYTHFAAPGRDELDLLERMVNQQIMNNVAIETNIMGIEEATASGAMALFGEKYGESVRVVGMGDFSKELCGGTHATATGDIGLFRITGESSVAAGVRRIEAMTGQAAFEYGAQKEAELAAVGAIVKASGGDVAGKVQKQSERIRELEKELRQLREQLFAGGGSGEVEVTDVGGVALIAHEMPGADPKTLRTFIDDQKNRLKSVVVIAGSAADGKAFIAVGVTDDLSKKYPAGKIVKEMAAMVGGGGGGRPDFAQAGGKNPEKLEEALSSAAGVIKQMGASS